MAAISERRGTPGAMMHCQIVCHRTTRTLLPSSRRFLHQRAALRRHRSWLFAAYMLHVEDPRASGHAERAEPPPRFGDDALLKRSLTRRSILKAAALTPPAL